MLTNYLWIEDLQKKNLFFLLTSKTISYDYHCHNLCGRTKGIQVTSRSLTFPLNLSRPWNLGRYLSPWWPVQTRQASNTCVVSSPVFLFRVLTFHLPSSSKLSLFLTEITSVLYWMYSSSPKCLEYISKNSISWKSIFTRYKEILTKVYKMNPQSQQKERIANWF